jgi:hypothetical protein
MRPLFGRLLALVAVHALAAAPAIAVAPLIDATIRPSQIAMGESAELTITASGSSMDPVALPQVPGLEFRVVGQSHRVEIIKGATLVTTALVVRVTPNAAGTYTIPAIAPRSAPLVLRVDPEGGIGRASRYGALSGSPRPQAGGHADGIRLTPDGSAYVRLVLPKKAIFVGESIPVQIEVGLRDGFVKSLNGLPTLTGQDFTLNNLSHQPERIQKVIDGKAFTLLTWHSVLAAVKPGKFSMAVQTPLTVRIRTRPAGESLLEDSMGDPFLQNFFGVTVPKDITAASAPVELTVLPLPAEGRPANFSGAVGSFAIGAELSAAAAAAGDPLTLRLHVTGSGNFDRVDSSMLDHVDGWKTYPPKSTFKPSDPLGDKGEKTFEQPLIAAHTGSQTLPALAFTYFDPETRHYATAHSAPLAVTITASAASQSLQRPSGSSTAPPGAGAAASTPGLRPDHVESGDGSESLVPPYLRPGFLAASTLVSLAFAGGWVGLRRRAADPGLRRPERGARRALLRLLAELDAAARAGNAAAFFSQARCALATAVGAGLDSESEEVRQLFALADETNYSGQPPTSTEFERWMAVVRTRLLAGRAP